MKKLSYLLSLVVLLSACSGGGTQNQNDSMAVATASTPAILGAIPTNDLTANVTVGNSTRTYRGQDFPDQNWLIFLDVELEKTHRIVIEWLVADVLVMIQEGSFKAVNFTDTINPALVDIVEGANLDYDCDRTPNLQEVLNGTNVGTKGGIPCILESRPVEIVKAEDIVAPSDETVTVLPVVQQNFNTFAVSGVADRVTLYSQDVKIQSTSPNRRSAYRVSLVNNVSNLGVYVDFLSDPRNGKFLRFGTNTDTVTLVPDASQTEFDCVAVRCSMPFNWLDQQWYKIVFEEDEIDSTKTTASIVDINSLEKTLLGSFIVPANGQWTNSSVVVYYHQQIAASDCAAGLSPITLHYQGGRANDIPLLGMPISTRQNDCLSWGSGASTSQITDDTGNRTYTVTIGKR